MNTNKKINKLLSIYVPTYNRCNKVCDQVTWLLEECSGFSDKIEIVVNDNGSEDGTEKALSDMQRQYRGGFQYHRNSCNVGIVGNAYMSDELTTGQYIWIIGDDDPLSRGVVGKVLGLLEEYPDLYYIFLNYKIMLGERTLQEKAYDGAGGYFPEGHKYVMEDFAGRSSMLILTSTSIYKREILHKTIELLPLDRIERYSWSYLTALIAIKGHPSYFCSDICAVNQQGEKSWADIEYDSFRGIMRSFACLTGIYSRQEIRLMYQGYSTRENPVIRIIFQGTSRKKWPEYGMRDLIFLLGQCPGTTLKCTGKGIFFILDAVRKYFRKK